MLIAPFVVDKNTRTKSHLRVLKLLSLILDKENQLAKKSCNLFSFKSLLSKIYKTQKKEKNPFKFYFSLQKKIL